MPSTFPPPWKSVLKSLVVAVFKDTAFTLESHELKHTVPPALITVLS